MSTSGRLLWLVTSISALLSFLLLAVGFVLATNPQQLAPASPSPPAADSGSSPSATPPATGEIETIVALGDSLTRGSGDANGQGYAGRVREKLEEQSGRTIRFTNLAVNGLESPELLEQLDQVQVKQLIAEANLILFTIGGNDLFQQTGGLYLLDEEKLVETAEQLAANFEEIIRRIRAINKDARIIYTSLYNPFGNTEAAADTVKPVLDWNNAAGQIAARHPGVIVVPTYDLFVQKEQQYLYSDHFHPNADGYSRMAERVLQALE
ncbi:GDSL-type esterase/lipase family protein [Brevibacillus sp. TJ4]|uniref:GDSL-type esterase/lipase family protein n=1 Tax=Brevibacillus sp. TJ4 TaxID=3234853 RepID=UPI0037D07B53